MLLSQLLSNWLSSGLVRGSGLLLCPTNFAMHSLDGEYDLWLVGGVVVFGEF
jgi:hypothetical protein